MIQFSFYLFVANIICIMYLMSSGEEYSRNYAGIARTNFAFMKGQFLVMALCYLGLAYSCIAQHDLLEYVNNEIKRSTGSHGYTLIVMCYVTIHMLWCSHFIDLCIRAHIYNHSKSGYYSTRLTRFITHIIHSIFKTNP